jgi:tetratricopeptide (TPR) repeat protein
MMLAFSFVVGAAQRKPKHQENAPQIRAQLIQQELSNPTLSPDQRAGLFIDLALTDYHLKDFSDEALVLEDALATGTTNATLLSNAHYYLGRAYQSLGETQEAEGEFDTVWQQYPTSQYQSYAAMQLGNLALDAGDPDAATEWYHTIISNQPLAKLAFLARDRLRDMSNGVSTAEITDESHRPFYLKEQFRLLDQFLYSQLNSNANALAQQLSSTPTNAALRAAVSYHLVHHYWMYGDAEDAAPFLSQSLNTTGSRHVQALILAGHVERALSQMPAALTYYGQAIAAAPAEPRTISAYQQSVRLLLRAGSVSEALAVASAGQQAFGSSSKLPAYLDRISTALRYGADPQWRNYAAQVAATATNELARRALMQLATDARLRSDWPDTETYYQRLTARPSRSWRSNADAQIHLFEAQLKQTNTVGAGQTATALLSSVFSLSSGASNTNHTIVAATNVGAMSSGGTVGGTNTTLSPVTVSPSLPPSDAPPYAMYRLGKIWLANGQTNQAVAQWQQVVASYSSTPYAGMAEFELARLAEANGNLTNALAFYRAFLSLPETASRYHFYAYANVIRLQEALGETADATVSLQTVQTTALQSQDAELQLSIVQYLWQLSDKTLANQLLQAGMANALAQAKTTTDPHKRLWWEYLIARRLTSFWKYGQLAQYATQFQPDLQNKALPDRERYSSYYLLIRALEKTGQTAQAQALCQNLVSSLPDDSMFVGHILYRMFQEAKAQGNAVTVRDLAMAAFHAQPTSSVFGQIMYLETAVEDFNTGNYTNALAKAIQLEQDVPMSSGKIRDWAAHFRWDCQYLQGRCLIAQGNAVAGQPLVVDALAKEHVIPYVVQLVGPPGGTQ